MMMPLINVLMSIHVPKWVEYVVLYVGASLVAIGAVCDLLGALGLLRFPNFFVRMHAATVGTIGGAVVPLIGIGLIALVADELGPYRLAVALTSFITAGMIMLVAPIGVHALAYATRRSGVVKVEPKVIDVLEFKLKEVDDEGGDGG